MLRAALRAIALLSLLSLLQGLSLVARANTIRVPADQPSIGAALGVAADGDTVLLADGIYSEGQIAWVLDRGVTIQSESDNPNACILDETMLGFGMMYNQTRTLTFRGITFRNDWDAAITMENDIVGEPALTGYILTASHCVFADSSYGGIAVRDSHALLTLTDCTFRDSGGIYGMQKSLVLSDCAVTNSYIYNQYTSSIAATRCIFTNSLLYMVMQPDSAGNLSMSVTNCKFDSTNLQVLNVGAPSVPCLVKNCTFSNSEGAIYNAWGTMHIVDCDFVNNTGPGVYNDRGDLTITNSAFVHNTAQWGGAVVGDHGRVTLLNCTFAYNQAEEGGAVYHFDDDPSSTGGLYVANCIFWGNSAPLGPQIRDISTTLTQITNSLLQDEPGLTATPDAHGNFTADPLFVRNPLTNGPSDTGDLHLQFGSPAIDRGLDTALPSGITTDLDGNPRLTGAHIDLGAYEYQNQSPTAHDDIVTAVKNTAVTIPVLANDSDPESDPLTVQSATSAGHGQVTINNDGTITYKPTGNYLGADSFTYTISDGQGHQSTATVHINVALQTSVLVTNASCVGTGSVALYARLVQGTVATKTNLLAGQPLLFLVNGTPIGSGTTDAYGKASVNYLPVAAGSFPITVQFSGSGTYAPSTGTGTLNVSPSATEITLQPTGGQTGGGTTIQGRLSRTNGNQGLVGMTVVVSVDGTVVGTVTTGVDGYFSCAYSIPANATVGAHSMTASFGGTALNSPSSGSATLTVVP